MAVDDPVTALRVNDGKSAPPIDVGMSGGPPVMTERVQRNVRALQFFGPLRGSACDTLMHRLEVPERLGRKLTVSDHHEIEIALVGLEVATGERAVKIHTDKATAKNGSHSR